MFTKEGDVVLDNAFGSGSFLVAAATEQRKFIGIEKNQEVHLFKEEQIDYIKIAKQRLSEVEEAIKAKQLAPPIFSALQPSAKSGPLNAKGMVDINAVISANTKIAI
ncbi:MAG: DNA methyltransferase [Nitrospira sp.]